MLYLLTILQLTYISVSAVNWVLDWSDEFNGHNISTCDWHFETGTGNGGWGNGEKEFYTSRPENVKVENGYLIITARAENYSKSEFTSTRMLSNRAWTFGKFEVKARLPKGKHLWPAIWMVPANWLYGFWVASGEIDIMENRGEQTNIVQNKIHYGGPWPNNVYHGSGEIKFSLDFSADFHTFSFEWEPHEMRWSVNGKVYHTENINKMLWSGKGTNPYTKNGQPFDIPFYLILNVAVSGAFFPANRFGATVTQEEAKHWAKNTMEVDYVRVYRAK